MANNEQPIRNSSTVSMRLGYPGRQANKVAGTMLAGNTSRICFQSPAPKSFASLISNSCPLG